MKYVAYYLIVGCVLLGMGWGDYAARCPNDDYPMGGHTAHVTCEK